MPSPVHKIAPALMAALGENASYIRAQTVQAVPIRAIVNRDVQQVINGFGNAVTERRTTLDLLRAQFPADPHKGDQITLTETAECFVLVRKEADDGDMLTYIVQKQ